MAEKSIFSVRETNGAARTGVVRTLHGEIQTPVFMPVGTQATVKALDPNDLHKLRAEIILCNTYHLFLRPGHDLVAEFGGLHRFMGWDGPILTDSGGFQVFSLGDGMEHGIGKMGGFFPDGKPVVSSQPRADRMAHIDDEGVTFKLPTDGSKYRLTPEKSIEIQEKLGADIILAFDECTSRLADIDYTKKALERTHRWAKRCVEAHSTRQSLFGIVQGGKWRDMREESARYIDSLGFGGYAIGGSFGGTKEGLYSVLEWVNPLLSPEKPRHLLGIGAINDIFECVERGVDMFDCVGPTRLARSGYLFISPESGGKLVNKWRLHILNAPYRNDHKPIDPGCDCFVCQNFSRAYIRHLFVTEELLAYRLATYHNLHLMLRLMEEIRTAIPEGTLPALKKKWIGE